MKIVFALCFENTNPYLPTGSLICSQAQGLSSLTSSGVELDSHWSRQLAYNGNE